MSIYLSIAIIIFLVIFVAAAIITLLSLIGKVQIAKNYQKQLFTVLLLEVIGVVIAFVSYNLKPDLSPNISEKLLLNNYGNWDWSYPEAGWRTKIEFKKNDTTGLLTFFAITYYHYFESSNQTYDDIPIYEWNSTKPIEISSIGKDLIFEVTKKTLLGIKKIGQNRESEIGQTEKGLMRLTTNIALTGSFLSDITHLDWGIVMNYRNIKY